MSEIDIGLTTEKGDLSNYMNNSEFDLIDMKASRTVCFNLNKLNFLTKFV